MDITKNYHEKKELILSLPAFPFPITEVTVTEKVLFYHDPLFFLSKCYLSPKYDPRLPNIKKSLENKLASFTYQVRSSISALKKNCDLLERVPYAMAMAMAMAMASVLQIKHSASLLEASISKKDYHGNKKRETSLMESLDIVICLRNLCVDTIKLTKQIAPVMQYSNRIALEDKIAILMKKITTLEEYSHRENFKSSLLPIKTTCRYLKMKLADAISKKQLRIKRLLEKINLGSEYKPDENFFDPIFMESVESFFEKIRLSREPESEERDKKLLNPALIESANYMLEKINWRGKDGSNEGFIESVFIQSIIKSVIKIKLEVSEMEKFLR